MAFELLVCRGGRGPKSYECYPEFLRSLDKHSMRPIFVPGPWNGMTAKIKNLWAYLNAGKHTGKWVLTTDAYDVVFGSPSLKRPNDLWPTLMERFKSFNAPIVYNAEKNCFPFGHLADKFPDHGKKTFAYLNSGFILAETEALIEVLRHMQPEKIPDDGQIQGYLNPGDQDFHILEFLQQTVPMKLDSDGWLCQTTHDVKLMEIATSQGALTALHHIDCSRAGPLAWHFNGSKNASVMATVMKSLRL